MTCDEIVTKQIERLTTERNALERERSFWDLIHQLLSTQELLLSRLRENKNEKEETT